MKRATVIEADKPIPSQLRIIQFNDGSPYETLHALVSKAITPYFKSYVKESGRADRYIFICHNILFIYPALLLVFHLCLTNIFSHIF